MLFNLSETVMVFVARAPEQTVYLPGKIIGRTIEQNPRYDVKLLDGELEQNVTEDRLTPVINAYPHR